MENIDRRAFLATALGGGLLAACESDVLEPQPVPVAPDAGISHDIGPRLINTGTPKPEICGDIAAIDGSTTFNPLKGESFAVFYLAIVNGDVKDTGYGAWIEQNGQTVVTICEREQHSSSPGAPFIVPVTGYTLPPNNPNRRPLPPGKYELKIEVIGFSRETGKPCTDTRYVPFTITE